MTTSTGAATEVGAPGSRPWWRITWCMARRMSACRSWCRAALRAPARSSYTYLLEAFAAHLRDSTPLPYDVTDTVPQAELVDAAYRAAGFEPRPSMSA